MSEMSSSLRRATNKVVRLAREEGFVIVGFVVPKEIKGEEFGWSLFSSCDEVKANDLTITIAEILKDVQQTKTVN